METRRESFGTPGHALLTLRIPSGDISLETIEGSETNVELRVHGGDGDAARELLEASRIDLRERGEGRWEVYVEVPRRRSGGFGIFFREPQVELRVQVPHGSAAVIETRSADIEARGRYGAVEVNDVSGDVRFDEIDERASIRTTSGDIRVDLVGGEADVQTTSGDVELGAVHGPLAVKSVSGDVRVRHAAEDVQVTTVSGDQDVQGVVQGDIRLNAVSGDVTVGVRRGSRVWIDAKSLSGDTTSELDLGDRPAEDEHDGSPLAELYVNTVSGDVRVVRASPVAH